MYDIIEKQINGTNNLESLVLKNITASLAYLLQLKRYPDMKKNNGVWKLLR